jgi:hypothetical protein
MTPSPFDQIRYLDSAPTGRNQTRAQDHDHTQACPARFIYAQAGMRPRQGQGRWTDERRQSIRQQGVGGRRMEGGKGDREEDLTLLSTFHACALLLPSVPLHQSHEIGICPLLMVGQHSAAWGFPQARAGRHAKACLALASRAGRATMGRSSLTLSELHLDCKTYLPPPWAGARAPTRRSISARSPIKKLGKTALV